MIARGASDIRGIRSLNARPGPMTRSAGFLRLYHLTAEKENVLKKIRWIERQKDQAEKRLSDIDFAIRTMEERTENTAVSNVRSGFPSTVILY